MRYLRLTNPTYLHGYNIENEAPQSVLIADITNASSYTAGTLTATALNADTSTITVFIKATPPREDIPKPDPLPIFEVHAHGTPLPDLRHQVLAAIADTVAFRGMHVEDLLEAITLTLGDMGALDTDPLAVPTDDGGRPANGTSPVTYGLKNIRVVRDPFKPGQILSARITPRGARTSEPSVGRLEIDLREKGDQIVASIMLDPFPPFRVEGWLKKEVPLPKGVSTRLRGRVGVLRKMAKGLVFDSPDAAEIMDEVERAVLRTF